MKQTTISFNRAFEELPVDFIEKIILDLNDKLAVTLIYKQKVYLFFPSKANPTPSVITIDCVNHVDGLKKLEKYMKMFRFILFSENFH